MAQEEEAKSRAAYRDGLACFERKAKAAGVFEASLAARINHYGVADHVAKVAQTYDLCLLPLAAGYDGQLEVVQAVVFSSGRPVLIFRAGDAAGLAKCPDLAVVAWDGSRSAARAMADALPILTRAKQVRLLTVLNEKPDATTDLGIDAQRHLRAHRVEATLETVDAKGANIGKVLSDYVKNSFARSFGHGRVWAFASQ